MTQLHSEMVLTGRSRFMYSVSRTALFVPFWCDIWHGGLQARIMHHERCLHNVEKVAQGVTLMLGQAYGGVQ